MMDGMMLQSSLLVPNGRFVLMRKGACVAVGDIVALSEHYRPGDVVIVSTGTFDALQAKWTKPTV